MDSKKGIDKTNINTIATIIAIIIGIPSFYVWWKGNMTFEIFISILSILLFVLLVLSRYSGNKTIKRCHDLEAEVTTWKDHAASWQDKAAAWKSDVETLAKEGEWARDLICSRGLQKEPPLELGEERKIKKFGVAYSARLGTPEGKRLSEFDILLHKVSNRLDENR